MNIPSAARILIVEDDDNIAMALEYVVQSQGMAVERIARGSEAMERIVKFRPDLILLDIMLPEVSGYEICAQVRRNKDLDTLKILMMTARGSAVEQRNALAHGADGFVAKPFDIAVLRSEISRLLGAGI